jgi:hypothetical protein
MGIRLRRRQEELDPRAYDMAEIVMDMREEFLNLPIETGYFCYKYAFDVNPFAENAQDMGRIIAKTEERAWRKFKKMENISKYAMWACIGIGVMVLGIYILSSVVF